jgi:diguanylate cyclase (GGDEF)-like protein
MARRKTSDQSSAQEWCDRGRLFLQGQEYDKAIAAFTQALRLRPRWAVAFRDRGRAYLHKGDWRNAADNFSDAIKNDPALFGEVYPDLQRLQALSIGPQGSTAETLLDLPVGHLVHGGSPNNAKEISSGRAKKNPSGQLRQMLKMVQQILACDNLRHFSEMIGRSAEAFFPDASGALYFLSDVSRLHYEVVWIWGEYANARQERILEDQQCWALAKMQPYVVTDCGKDPVCAHAPARVGNYMCVPLMAHGEALGVLYVRTGPCKLSPGQKKLAMRLGRLIGPAFWIFRTREKYRQEAIRDERTGLFTSRNMRDSLTRELHRAARKQESIGIILLDIDHFKDFNTHYTHEGANALLGALGKFLQKQFRGADIACRYGGDEFIIIVPGASLEETRQRAETLREDINRLRVDYRERWLGPITVSLGVASSSVNGASPDDLLHAVACALRKAKEAGRNRVELAPPPSPGETADS